MAADATKGMNVEAVQKDIMNNYYTHLKQFGYMSPEKIKQVVFAILLLDAVSTFYEHVTGEFQWDVNRIMHHLDCCSCTITWDAHTATQPFYVVGKWTTTVSSHSHVIGDIVGLQAKLNTLTTQVRKAINRANAGL